MHIADGSAIVTGGASGLGLATVEHLAGRGAQVVIADLASSAGADIAKRTGSVFVAADVTDPDAMRCGRGCGRRARAAAGSGQTARGSAPQPASSGATGSCRWSSSSGWCEST